MTAQPTPPSLTAKEITAVDAVKFLQEAQRYFANRDTKGEDKAHWANVYNAENCGKIVTAITRLAKAAEAGAALAAAIENAVMFNGQFSGLKLHKALAKYRTSIGEQEQSK